MNLIGGRTTNTISYCFCAGEANGRGRSPNYCEKGIVVINATLQ